MIQTELQKRHPKWKVHHVKAYDPVTYEPTWKGKYDNQYFKDLENEIGILAARAEYLNEPHIEGKIFTQEQIQYGKRPALNHFTVICGHWDIAYAGTPTADFNAVKVWGLHGKNFWNIDNYVKRSKMRQAIEWMVYVQMNLPPSVTIHWSYESQFWNDEVQRTIEEVEKQYGVNLALRKVDTPKTKKYDRMLKQHVYYQNGRVYYDEKLKAHNDTQVGIAQLLSLEPGYNSNDDAPDADEQCFSELSHHLRSGNERPIAMASYQKQHRF
jgi:phage terminase large subunit-like protein